MYILQYGEVRSVVVTEGKVMIGTNKHLSYVCEMLGLHTLSEVFIELHNRHIKEVL